ncbi:iron-containing redox enzyme family protein [Arenibaculum sp.]|jgi:hypothetical protein|uniref:iron-containing redox enzyme family protein n=1 Tax=Arenibaculum sp. TaxID=2865862 RepID=UPI002E14F752|nr:iron-containing redox enzyme family protein [Arenibaculum sp.]
MDDSIDPFYVNPIDEFCFSPTAQAAAEAILAQGPAAIFTALAVDQESEGVLLAAKRVLDTTLDTFGAMPPAAGEDGLAVDRDRLAAWLEERRAVALRELDRAASHGEEASREVLRERAALSLVAGCWLDTVSQPATQPAAIVNLLFGQHWRLQGEGNPLRSAAAVRRRVLEERGIFLPPVGSASFARESGMGDATALHGAFLLSLSRYPATRLPELVGVHCVHHLFGIDDALAGTRPVVTPAEARATLDAYLDLVEADADTRRAAAAARRLLHAVTAMAAIEAAHARLLAETAERHTVRTVEARAAEILKRHAPFAGGQHGRVRVGGAPLADLLGDPGLDMGAFLRAFKRSWYLRAAPGGSCRFLDALKFGGPMFGIFTEEEARVLKEWAAAPAPPSDEAEEADELVAPGEAAAAAWLDRIRHHPQRDVRFEEAAPLDDRTLFHRLVNVENFPHVLPLAREKASEALSRARASAAPGRFTDASFFAYAPEALEERIAAVYWDKLVSPYVPLDEIPARDEVVFGQKVFALGSLIDGSWAFRIGNVGRYDQPADGILFAIYADEMGLGDVRKNHITLIRRVLDSMGIALPHVRDAAFIDQDEIPDAFYAFPVHQLCLSLFPDGFYPEILGYNLGIEMFGLGELRLHEIQKLDRWGFDAIYERTHLSIDNLSVGHARRSADAIALHLDRVGQRFGAEAKRREWRRVWDGYAYFAHFAEGRNVAQERAEMLI